MISKTEMWLHVVNALYDTAITCEKEVHLIEVNVHL